MAEVLLLLVLVAALAVSVTMLRFHLHARPGCCTSCRGTGKSRDVETNGRCWDCFGTGHPHDGRCRPWWVR